VSASPAAPPKTETIHRSCPLCEAHCGIAVTVEPEGGHVVTIRGDAEDPVSGGYLCPKAYGLKGLQEDPDRLRTPLVRRDGRLEEASWEEALDAAAAGLRAVRDAHGADAVATYVGNPNAHDVGATFYLGPLLRALGTRWRFSASSVDQWPKMLSSVLLFGAPLAIPVPDVDRTDFLLVLGANPLASNGSLMTAPDMPGRLRRLRERGGRLVVVDPRRSETAALADRHLFLRPGTDALLLFALIRVLFDEGLVQLGRAADFVGGVDEVEALARDFPPERVAAATGIPAEEIRRLAHELAAAPRAAVYGRMGTCTQAFGALASWLVDVLNTLTGNLDREGGVMFPWPAHAPADPRPGRRGKVPYARWRSRVRGLAEFAGELPAAALAEEIDTPGEGRVRALLTVAGNPVLSTPNGARLDAALAGLEFIVAVDIYRNETTRHADVILPSASPLERANYDAVFYGLAVRNHAKWSPPALAKPEGARASWEIFLELAGRLGGVPAQAVDDLVLDALLRHAVGPGSACPDLGPEEAKERLAADRGPERLLDLMLRAGRYGDRFQEGSDGLSLARLRAATHGLDLGPLGPRLPEMLATADGRVDLAPELLVGDVPRLRAALDASVDPARPFLLIGRRQVRSNNSWMHNVPALAKGRDRCTLRVAGDDAARLGLRTGDRARVRSRVGAVEAPVEVSDEMMPGVVSLPHGFGHDAEGAALAVAARKPGVNANVLTDEQDLDVLSGNAVLNGVPVAVERVPTA
jgi:anaerobic selenocysteine-containing dehydrogenase